MRRPCRAGWTDRTVGQSWLSRAVGSVGTAARVCRRVGGRWTAVGSGVAWGEGGRSERADCREEATAE